MNRRFEIRQGDDGWLLLFDIQTGALYHMKPGRPMEWELYCRPIIPEVVTYTPAEIRS